MPDSYDSIIIISFGGPERMEDVAPFLENVVRGKNVPSERLALVAHHYELVSGKSPVNEQMRHLVAALQEDLRVHGLSLPVYWGNRNWHPYLSDTLAGMQKEGRKKALAFVTSAYSSYSSCRQYLEDIRQARETAGKNAPQIDKIRSYYNHPLFVETDTDHLLSTVSEIADGKKAEMSVAFTAHSIPLSMGGCSRYAAQLEEICALVAAKAGVEKWQLVYQSRSGPPAAPWLGPDILEHIRKLASESVKHLVIHPLGFVHDNLEIIYDLDYEAQALCAQLGMTMLRVRTACTGAKFVTLMRELIAERVKATTERPFLGTMGPLPDNCLPDCCLPDPGKREV